MSETDRAQVFLSEMGHCLRKTRESRGYTLDDLEFFTGIDSSDLNKMELGQRNITMKTLLKLAEGLKVHPREIFNFEMDLGID